MYYSYIYSLQIELPSVPILGLEPIALGAFTHNRGKVEFDLTELEKKEVYMPIKPHR